MSENELTMFPSTANRAYAYHIFPQEADNTLGVKPKDKSVKLIIELEYKDAENVTTTEYATLRLAKANTTLSNHSEKIASIESRLIWQELYEAE